MFNHDIYDYFSQYLMPPGGYEDFTEAKLRYLSGGSLSEEDARTVVATSAYYAAVLRTAYKRYVKEQNIAPDDYWDTIVEVFLNGGIWSEQWRKFFKTPLVLNYVKGTLFPSWTPIGLCGTNWSTLQQMMEFWCARFLPETMAV
ncbi:MAG TPA: hypothetical protein VN426_09945 [Syntrophomonadaceae bacterium]|nr:hypothetical protein [Syntrophomonadaceae bacterium]